MVDRFKIVLVYLHSYETEKSVSMSMSDQCQNVV